MRNTLRFIISIIAFAACSSAELADSPTWVDDVRPILVANCVRCHGPSPTGGAPDGFRLDVYADTTDSKGRLIRGAGSMAEFIALRTDYDALERDGLQPMPPRFLLDDRQRETLMRWWDPELNPRGFGEPPPPRDPRRKNTAPTLELLSTEQLETGIVKIRYDLRDADGDIVIGELKFGENEASAQTVGSLLSGIGSIDWDAAAHEPMEGFFYATVNDGSEDYSFSLSSYEVLAGPRAPTVTINGIRENDIVNDTGTLLTVSLGIIDSDSSNVVVNASLLRGEDEVLPLETNQTVAAGDYDIELNTTALEEGGGYHLYVSIGDGRYTRNRTVGPFHISHQSTTETFDSVSSILIDRCGSCHVQSSRFADPQFDFSTYEDTPEFLGVFELRGQIYRRLIQQRTMPPPSHILSGRGFITEEERSRIADWILGGAPQ